MTFAHRGGLSCVVRAEGPEGGWGECGIYLSALGFLPWGDRQRCFLEAGINFYHGTHI